MGKCKLEKGNKEMYALSLGFQFSIIKPQANLHNLSWLQISLLNVFNRLFLSTQTTRYHQIIPSPTQVSIVPTPSTIHTTPVKTPNPKSLSPAMSSRRPRTSLSPSSLIAPISPLQQNLSLQFHLPLLHLLISPFYINSSSSTYQNLKKKIGTQPDSTQLDPCRVESIFLNHEIK